MKNSLPYPDTAASAVRAFLDVVGLGKYLYEMKHPLTLMHSEPNQARILLDIPIDVSKMRFDPKPRVILDALRFIADDIKNSELVQGEIQTFEKKLEEKDTEIADLKQQIQDLIPFKHHYELECNKHEKTTNDSRPASGTQPSPQTT